MPLSAEEQEQFKNWDYKTKSSSSEPSTNKEELSTSGHSSKLKRSFGFTKSKRKTSTISKVQDIKKP